MWLAHRDRLEELVREQPDATLAELRERLGIDTFGIEATQAVAAHTSQSMTTLNVCKLSDEFVRISDFIVDSPPGRIREWLDPMAVSRDRICAEIFCDDSIARVFPFSASKQLRAAHVRHKKVRLLWFSAIFVSGLHQATAAALAGPLHMGR